MVKLERVRKYDLDDNAFSVLSEGASYWTGFLMADGSVDEKKFYMQVRLQPSDAGHLEKLRLFLKASHPVHLYPQHNCCVFAITSEKLVRDLIQFGVLPQKSQKDIKAHVCLAYNRDFFRGLVDGDGSVGINKRGRPFILLTGCRSMVEDFAKFARLYCLRAQGSLSVNVNGATWEYKVEGPSAVEVIRQLYLNSSISLDRKKTKADDILNRPGDFENRPPPRGVDNHNAKLTWENACEIRAARGKVKQVDLAERFGVSQVVISQVQLGKTWVGDEPLPVKKHDQRGETNARAKLTWEKVDEIRKLKGELSSQELGLRYGVSRATILNVWNGQTWKPRQ